MNVDATSASLRFGPPRSYRVLYGVFIVFGLLFASSGLAAGADVGAGVMVGLFGLLFAGVGVAAYRSGVWVEGQSLFTRFLRVRRIDSSSITSITVEPHGSGSNLYPGVHRREGRIVWLYPMGRFDTERSRATLNGQVRAIIAALDL